MAFMMDRVANINESMGIEGKQATLPTWKRNFIQFITYKRDSLNIILGVNGCEIDLGCVDYAKKDSELKFK